MSDGESTIVEVEEDEDPPEVISEDDDDDSLADLYMPLNDADSATFVHVYSDSLEICEEKRFCIKGPESSRFWTGRISITVCWEQSNGLPS